MKVFLRIDTMPQPFETLFGTKSEEVKKTCLLLPTLPKGLLKNFGIAVLNKGALYATAHTSNLTLIHTKMGAGFVGDVVLYLKETPCEKIILFGSCGALPSEKALNLGDLVCLDKSFNLESFTEFLENPSQPLKSYSPDSHFLKSFLNSHSNLNFKMATCGTVGSLKLEEECLDWLLEQGIDIVDMESSAFFAAAKKMNLQALALFYVSDHVPNQLFYQARTQEQNEQINLSISKACRSLIIL